MLFFNANHNITAFSIGNMVYYWYIKKIGFKLQGVEGYRLRVGNFRVLFDVNGVIIDIIDIGNRGQIYTVKEKILGAVTIMSEEDA